MTSATGKTEGTVCERNVDFIINYSKSGSLPPLKINKNTGLIALKEGMGLQTMDPSSYSSSSSSSSQEVSLWRSLSITTRESRVIYHLHPGTFEASTEDALKALNETAKAIKSLYKFKAFSIEEPIKVDEKIVESKEEKKEEEKKELHTSAVTKKINDHSTELLSSSCSSSSSSSFSSSSSSSSLSLKLASLPPSFSCSSTSGMFLSSRDASKSERQLMASVRSTVAYKTILECIKRCRSVWFTRADLRRKNLYIPSSKEAFLPTIPRSMQCDLDGTLYIHFIKEKKGDTVLGKGGFKAVKTALNFDTGELFASSGLDGRKNELKKMELVKGIEGFIQPLSSVSYINKRGIKKRRVITKLCEMGNLFQNFTRFNIQERVEIGIQLLTSVAQLHARGLIHRDLKMQNVVLTRESPNRVKAYICDLASLCLSEGGGKSGEMERSENCTTSWHMSPECAQAYLKDRCVKKIKDDKGIGAVVPSALSVVTNFKLDIWSLGTLFHLMFFRERLSWADPSNEVTIQLLANLKTESFFEPAKETIYYLIWSMLRINPEMRPSAAEALASMQSLYEHSLKERGGGLA